MSTTQATPSSSLISSLSSTPATTSISTGSGSSGGMTVDTNEWLTLLTTQLKYQDPMQPTDSTQFVAELAQFNGVQQQVQTNVTLNGISSRLSAGSLGQAASLIGHQVQAAAGSYVVPSSGSAAKATYSYATTNSSLKDPHLQVTNAAGAVVATVPVSPGSGSVSFSGTAANGAALPAGSYGLSIVGGDTAGTLQAAGTLTTKGTVTQVLQAGTSGAWELQLDNGSTVDASSITQLSADS